MKFHQKWFKKTFTKGISNIRVGYLGGSLEKPTYQVRFLRILRTLRRRLRILQANTHQSPQQVCSGKTGHAEVVTMNYDPDTVSYKDLVRFFFRIHDSTTLNRQGNDVGTQYRSAIFYYDEQQRLDAEEIKDEIQKSGKIKGTIVTEITPATTFYPAEDYHQGYLDANPNGMWHTLSLISVNQGNTNLNSAISRILQSQASVVMIRS